MSCLARGGSGPHPGATHLEEVRDHVTTDSEVEARLYPVAARELVTKAPAARDHALPVVEPLEVVPGATASAEGDHTEALPELPAQLRFEKRHLLALVTQEGHAAHVDERCHVERWVTEYRRRFTSE